MSKPQLQLIWSLDAFSENQAELKETVDFLKVLEKKNQLKISPIYILSPKQMDSTKGFSLATAEHFAMAAEMNLREKLQKIDLKNIQPPEVIIEYRPSVQQPIDRLAAMAKKNGKDFIILRTNARKGKDNIELGSFTESLMIYTSTPLMVINPQLKTPQQYKRIVFLTDFSPESKKSFKKICQLALQLGLDVTIAHKLPDFSLPSAISKQAQQINIEKIKAHFESEKNQIQQKSAKWIEDIKKQKIKGQLKWIEGSADLKDSILDFCNEQNESYIAFALQSSKESTLPGSITRHVMKSCQNPVLLVP